MPLKLGVSKPHLNDGQTVADTATLVIDRHCEVIEVAKASKYSTKLPTHRRPFSPTIRGFLDLVQSTSQRKRPVYDMKLPTPSVGANDL